MTAGIRKVALLVSFLPDRLVTEVLGRIPADRAAQIRQRMRQPDQDAVHDRRGIVRDFMMQAGHPANLKRPRVDSVSSWPPSLRMRQPLSSADVQRLIADESPQAQAAVLAHLPPSLVAEVLGQFSKQRRLRIIDCLDGTGRISSCARDGILDVVHKILGHQYPAPDIGTWTLTTIDDAVAHASGANRRRLAETVEQVRQESTHATHPIASRPA